MKEIVDRYGDKWYFEETPELKEKVYQEVLNWFSKYGMSGESICQNDRPQINAPEFLADICDNLFKFKSEEEYNEK